MRNRGRSRIRRTQTDMKSCLVALTASPNAWRPEVTCERRTMKLVVAGTGASGMIYLQRLLDQIDCRQNDVHLVLSGYAKQVVADEIEKLRLPAGVQEYPERT